MSAHVEWEYRTERCQVDPILRKEGRENVQRRMGKDGWELVSTADDGYMLFFKRRKK